MSRIILRSEGRLSRHRVAGGATVAYGGIAALSAAGLIDTVGGAGQVVIGIIASDVIDDFVEVERGYAYALASAAGPDACTAASIGRPAYAVDGHTVSAVEAVDRPLVGIIHQIDAMGVHVRI